MFHGCYLFSFHDFDFSGDGREGAKREESWQAKEVSLQREGDYLAVATNK
jgi:hypothetical protein